MKKIICKTLFTLTLLFCVAAVVFPLYVMVKIAVSPPAEVFSSHPPYWPRAVTDRHLHAVLASGEAFFGPLSKSVLVALGTSVLSLALATPAAFAIARFPSPVRYVCLMTLFLSRMLPEISIALPISIRFIELGLFDTSFGLILAHLIKVLPIACFIMVGAFAHLPIELDYQAQIDGCSKWDTLWRVAVPISSTTIAVGGLFSFLLSWDEFIYAMYLTLAEPTLPLKMYYYVSRGNIFYSATYAVLIILPVLLLTVAMHRHIKSEHLAGAIQG